MYLQQSDLTTTEGLMAFAIREREMSVSDREWKHRLRGYGYDLKQAGERTLITSIGQDFPLCEVPQGKPVGDA